MLGQGPHSKCCFHAASVGPVQQLVDVGGGDWLADQLGFTEARSSRPVGRRSDSDTVCRGIVPQHSVYT
jgi:hypothetical protein